MLSYAAAAAGSLGLLLWYSGSLWLTLWTLIGSLAVLAGVRGAGAAAAAGGRVLGMQAGSGWRLALAGLARRRRENVAQILIFGLAIMLLLILVLLRTALLDEWRNEIPDDAPNHFVMNVTPGPGRAAVRHARRGHRAAAVTSIRWCAAASSPSTASMPTIWERRHGHAGERARACRRSAI